MSGTSALGGLHSPLRDIVLGAVNQQDGNEVFGKTEADKLGVAEWIGKIASGEVGNAESLQDLDKVLTTRTYVASNYLTAADIALYGTLHPIFSQLGPAQYYSHPAVTRYFDHIQNHPSVRKSADALGSGAFALVLIDIEGIPKGERKKAEVKKKEKKDKAPVPDAPTQTTPASTEVPANSVALAASTEPSAPKKEKKVGKEKKDKEGGLVAESKKGGSGGKSVPEAAADSGDPVPSMIDLRVGHIVDIMKHPDADGLYVEQIDIGEETGPRTVVSGLVHYIPIEEMRDKYLIAVCNLKPANMRGVKSYAMVLCATSKEGKEDGIELIQPPPGAKPGDRVYFEGPKYENATPLSQLNPKKKIFETVQPGFTTLESKEAAWIDPVTKSVHRIRTRDGVCVAPSLVGASLS